MIGTFEDQISQILERDHPILADEILSYKKVHDKLEEKIQFYKDRLDSLTMELIEIQNAPMTLIPDLQKQTKLSTNQIVTESIRQTLSLLEIIWEGKHNGP